jgi:WD40 repeat protein
MLTYATQVRILRAHRTAVTALAFAADKHLLVSGAEDGEVVVWELRYAYADVCYTAYFYHTHTPTSTPPPPQLWCGNSRMLTGADVC